MKEFDWPLNGEHTQQRQDMDVKGVFISQIARRLDIPEGAVEAVNAGLPSSRRSLSRRR